MEENNLLYVNRVKYIVIHCSDTNQTDTITDIHKLHLSFGWEGVGYHKVIEYNGKVQNGRPEFWIGAHARGYNDKSLGICLIGKKNFTDSQFIALEKILRKWKVKYKNAKIISHSEISDSNKTCPNFDVKKWCNEIGLDD